MECTSLREELVALIDGELEAERARQIKEHLSRCPACAAELALLEKAAALVRETAAPALSADFESRFWARFQREKRRSFFDITHYLPRWALAAATAAAVVLVTGWFVLTSSRSRVSEEEKILTHHLELFSDYEAINLMELLQDLDVIEMLDEEG